MFPLQDANQSRSAPVVTWIIIAINVLVFFFEASLPKEELNSFLMQFGVVPSRFVQHFSADQLFTLVSSMFLHAGWLHLISNMWALHIFADNIEDRFGHSNFLVFYFICGLVAGLTQVATGVDVNLPTIGASGAIAGVLGAYMFLFPAAKIITLVPVGFIPVFINVPAYFYLGFWFLSQMVTGWATLDHSHLASEAGAVAWWAHVGGFVAGAILLNVFQRSDYRHFHKDEYWPW